MNCRSYRCHLVVTAREYDGEQVRDQLKGWGKRRLNADQRNGTSQDQVIREHWWTGKGSVRFLFDEKSLEAAILYTLEAQEVGGSKFGSRRAERREPSGISWRAIVRVSRREPSKFRREIGRVTGPLARFR